MRKSYGFTLIELLIATTLGLLVLSAVTSIFVTVVGTNNENLKYIRLNQELRAVMGLMSRDIRRAGANKNAGAEAAAASSSGSALVNDYSCVNTTTGCAADSDNNLTVSSYGGVANSCITFSYNSGETTEDYGFRLDNGAVESRSSCTQGECAENDCTDGTWQELTDTTMSAITNLHFTLSSTCSVTTCTDPCVCKDNGGVLIRLVGVTITGQLVNDSDVVRTLEESIKIRNDEF